MNRLKKEECLYRPPQRRGLLEKSQMAIGDWEAFLYIFETGVLNVYFSADMLLQIVL